MNESALALLRARGYIIDGIAQYGYELCKQQACVWLYLGNLDRAILETKTALFIMRLRRVI